MPEVETLHPIEHGAEILHVTRDTYIKNLRNGKWPGHKSGRRWYVTDADIQAALDETYRPAQPAHTDPAGLTPTARRRLGKVTA